MEKKTDIWGSSFFILIGIGVTVRAVGLQIGTATEPKPGFFPFLGGIGLTVLSGIYLVRSLWRGGGPEDKIKGDLWRPTFLVLGLVIYVLTFNPLGYVLATFILSAIVLWIMDTRPWWTLAGVSLGLALASYILFDRLLGVTLPKGIMPGLW